MVPQAEQSAEQELEAKLFAARKLEDPRRAVRVVGGSRWSSDRGGLSAFSATLRTTLECLGVRKVDAGLVKEFDAGRSPHWKLPSEGGLGFPEAFHQLADRDIWADRPNDFTCTVRFPHSEDLDVILEFTSEECGIICQDCSEPGADIGPLLPGESCEHLSDEFDIRLEYHVMLVRPDHKFVPGCYGYTHFP